MNKASVLLAASAAVLALTAAGCGSSGGSDPSSSSSDANANSTLEKAVKYTQCMRKNGATNFPDPDKDGKFTLGAGTGDKNSPQMKKAIQACKSQEPPGLEDNSPTKVAKEQAEWLKWARCMRKNGISNLPDPQGGKLLVPRDKINVNSPQFKNAMKACKDVAKVGNGSGNG